VIIPLAADPELTHKCLALRANPYSAHIALSSHFVLVGERFHHYLAIIQNTAGGDTMRKLMRAGVFALATMVSSVAIDAAQRPASATEVVLSDAQIARFKSGLRLSATQERYWAPVEATLRDIMRRKAESSDSEGIVQRVKNRVKAVVVDTQELRRIGSVAMPLIQSLDPEQKQTAMRLVQSMGFGTVAAAF
jgi:hypothetical protein